MTRKRCRFRTVLTVTVICVLVGILAALFIALDPFAWLFAGTFYSETLFTFMFALALLLYEMERNDLQMSMMMNNVRDNPIEFLSLLPIKVVRFWQHEKIFPNTPYKIYPLDPFFVYQKTHYRLVFLLSLIGLFMLYFNGRREAFIILTSYVAIFSLMVLILWGDALIRMPLHPMMAVAGAYALVFAYDKLNCWSRVQLTEKEGIIIR